MQPRLLVRLIKLILGALAALTLLAAVLVTTLLFLDIGVFRGQLEAGASEAFGRQVTFEGPLHLEPSLWPILAVEDVRIGNPDWASRPDFARVQRLEVQVALLPLLRGELEVLDVTFRGADVLLEVGAGDTNNFTFGQRVGPPALPGIRRFNIRDSMLGYRTAGGDLHSCAVIGARVRNMPGQPVKLEGQLACNQVPMRLSLTAGTPEQFASPTVPWPVALNLSTGDASVVAEGGLPNPGALDGAEFRISIEGKSAGSLETLFDADLPVRGPFQFSTTVSSKDGLFALTDITGYVNAKDATRLLEINQGEASAGASHPSKLSVQGVLNDAPLRIVFAGDSLTALAAGAEDWPFTIEARSDDALLTADGVVKREAGQPALVLQAELQGKQVATLNPLLGASLSDTGPYRLSAELRASGETYSLSRLEGNIGSTDIAGELQWEQAGARPSLRGRFASRSLHVEELFAASDSNPTDQTKPDLLDRPILLDWVDSVDVELSLDVGRVLGGPVPIRDAALRARLIDGELAISPFKATLGDAPLTGDLSLALEQDVPAIRLAAQVQGLDLTDMLEQLAVGAQIQARAENLTLAVKSRGGTLRTLLARADLSLKAERGRIAYRGDKAQKPWQLDIATGGIEAREAQPARISVDGKYRAMPFALAVDSVSLAALAAGATSWPLRIEARSADAVFAADGVMNWEAGGPALALQARLEGRRFTTLNPLFDFSLPDTGPYRLSAELKTSEETYSVSRLEGNIGSTDIAGELQWRQTGARPFLTVRLASRSLHVQDLFAAPDASPADNTKPDALDRPIPLDWLVSMDAELALDVGRVRGGPVPIRNATVTAKLSNGRLAISPLRATLAGAPVTGDLSLALEQDAPAIRLAARSKQIDLGKLFEASAQIQGRAEDLTLSLRSRGRTMRSLLRRANLSLKMQSGRIVYTHEKVGKPRELEISAAEIVAREAQPLRLSLDGEYRAMPLSLVVDTDTLEGLASAVGPWPLGVSLQAFQASLNANGSVSHPFEGRGFELAFEITGRDLKELDPLIDFVMPLRGDYSIKGRFADDANRYTLSDIQIHVGQSDIGGSIVVVLEEERPRISADLSSRMIHYDDLEFVESADEPGDPTRVIPDYIIPVEALQAVNLDFDLAAEQIRMHGGNFGDLAVKATLENGRSVWSVRVTNDRIGGRLSAKHEVDVNTNPPLNSLHLRARDLDYGLLLTQAEVTDLAEGRVDVDIELAGPGATQRSFLGQADGHIRVTGGPGRISNRGLQLWTSDLFVTMLSGRWLRQPVEDINCIVGHIDVADGVAKTDKLLLDTARFTLAGSGALDLDTEEIDFLLSPNPKRRRLVSLANPVRVSGTLADPQVAITVLPRRRTATTSGLLAGLVNPAFLLLAYSDTRARGNANPCAAAIAERDSTLTPDDFTLETTRDLVRLCRVRADDPLYNSARGFCLAYVDGVWDYHAALTAGAGFDAIACPGPNVTRDQAVDVFIAWAEANPQTLDSETAVDGVMRAFSDRWPCPAD